MDYIYNSSDVTPCGMMTMLRDKCGVRCNTKTGKWTCNNGFMIEEYFNTSMFPATKYYYYVNNESVRKGATGEKGTWSK